MLLTKFSTIADLFATVSGHPDRRETVAFLHKEENDYVPLRHGQLYDDVVTCAQGLHSLGLSRGDVLGIMSENRIEWIIVDLACASSGIVDVPIFPVLTPEQLAYIFRDAEVAAILCSNRYQLRKLKQVVDDIPTLRHVILIEEDGLVEMDGERSIGNASIVLYSELMESGTGDRDQSRAEFEVRARAVQPEDLLTMIYTSGTTGHPKGVMLTHRNLVSNIEGAASVFPIDHTDVVLSYLPLCHSFERMAGYYTCYACGATIAFAENIDSLVRNLGEVRPTLMTTVPRFLERFRSRVEGQVRKKSPIARKLFRWSTRVGLKRYRQMQSKGAVGPILASKYALADRLALGKIREKTGGRLRFFVSGGAALPRDVAEFMYGLGISVVEGYGLTETSPVLAANRIETARLGTVGQALPNVELRIAEDGEILARGPNIMKGYHNDEIATRETIDPDGWLHTGDVGNIDHDGYLTITDRKKHLFVSSSGKNIAPGPIEELLSSSPVIERVVIFGDRQPYLSALVLPDFEALAEALREEGVDPGSPTDPDARQRMAASDGALLILEPEIRQLQKNLSSFERVRRFKIIADEFTVDSGLLTPTLKVKRREVAEAYADLIEQMYTT